MTLNDAAEDYLNSCRHERGLAQTTVVTYASWVHHFQKWLEKDGRTNLPLTDFTTELLRTYQYSLSKRGLRPRSIRAAFHPLKGLGAFLTAHGVLAENPCLKLTMPKKDAAKRLTISNAEVVALLDGAGRLHPMRRAALARAVVYTLVYSGVRFQELLDLKVQDVDTGEGTLLVRSGKGSKSRLLNPPRECMDVIREWLKVRGECAHDWLFAENRGRRMGDMGVRDLLEAVKAASGLQGHDNIMPHSLRHNFASRLLANGASIKVVQAALGHQRLETTALYTHLAEDGIRQMAQYAAVRPAETPQAPPVTQQPQRPQKAAQFARQRREGRQGSLHRG